MKYSNQKVLNLGLFAFILMSTTSVQAQNCAVPPTCESLGYIKTAKDCQGISSLKCPFDTSKLYCTTYNDLDPLSIGDIVYEDMTTSRPDRLQTEIAKGKKAMGYVFNAEKRIAILALGGNVEERYFAGMQYNESENDAKAVEWNTMLQKVCKEYIPNDNWECNEGVGFSSSESGSGKELTKKIISATGGRNDYLGFVDTKVDQYPNIEFFIASSEDAKEFEEARHQVNSPNIGVSSPVFINCKTLIVPDKCDSRIGSLPNPVYFATYYAGGGYISGFEWYNTTNHKATRGYNLYFNF